MRITVTIDQPTGDFQERLLALLAEHATDVQQDTHWTIPRAENYYRSLPERARRIVKEAATRDGYVSADDLRDDEDSSLRGHSGALSRALSRGVTQGRWPEGMQAPIEPQGPGFGKVLGYRMQDELVPTFFTAIKNVQEAGTPIDPRKMNETVDAMDRLGEALDQPMSGEKRGARKGSR